MPEASGDVTYAFASQGFNTGAFQNMNIAGPGPADYFFTGDVTGSGRGCTGSNCNITFYGGFGGENPEERAGFVYQVFGGSFSAPRIQGSVIYAPEGTVPGASTGGGGTGSGFTGTRDGIVYYTYTGGSLASGFGGSADLLDGALTKFTSALGTVTIGSAEAVEAGDVGTLAWARWTNGTVESSGVFNSDTPLVASDGYHVMAGAASTSLPGSGTINYELIGTTSATDKFGAAPGTMSGDLAIAFGSTSKVGFDLAMNFGARGYGVSSTGGAASPGSSEFNIVAGSGGPNFSAAFNSILGNVTGTGGACAASCQVSVSGALYGPNASHVGVAMNVFDAGSGTAVQASGLAIFGAPGAAGTAGSGGGLTTAAAIAPTAQSADWDRWEVSGDAPVTAALGTGVAPGMAPGIDALQASGIQFNAEQLQRLEAHLAAQMR